MCHWNRGQDPGIEGSPSTIELNFKMYFNLIVLYSTTVPRYCNSNYFVSHKICTIEQTFIAVVTKTMPSELFLNLGNQNISITILFIFKTYFLFTEHK